jgi:hypothetical protein
MGRIGMDEARAADLAAGRALAAELINPQIASEEALRAIHARNGAGLYVVREEGVVTGMLALVLLNEAGFHALLDDTFAALNPALEHVAGRTEEPAAIYGWGVAGANRAAAATAALAAQASCEISPCPFFARAATEAGLRLLTRRMMLTLYPGSASGLLWRPWPQVRRAA